MSTQPNLIPRLPRKMKQPPKDEIRRRLEVANAQAAFDATPRWWRLWHRVWVRVVEVDQPAELHRNHVAPPERSPSGRDIFRSKSA